MFDNLVTRCTIAYKIRQSICLYILFNSKYSKRGFMMNVKVFADFFFSDRAVLTFIIISMSCIATLLVPVFSIIRIISTLPTSVIFTSPHTRFTHPIIGALFRTECFFFNYGWASIKLFIAEQTHDFKSVVLWVLRAVFSVFFLINPKTSHCAECFSESLNSVRLALNKAPAYFARNFYKLSTCCISTFKRTIFLLRMRAGGLKFHLALKTWFGEDCPTGFISANNRAKTNNPVRSLFESFRFTIFTGFHKANIIII